MSGMKRISCFFTPLPNVKKSKADDEVSQPIASCSKINQDISSLPEKNPAIEAISLNSIAHLASISGDKPTLLTLDSTSRRIKPCHPVNIDALLPVMQIGKKTLRFQSKWFQDYPWLHFQEGVNGILCFYCSNCDSNISHLNKNRDNSFVCIGYQNWKHALGKDGGYEKHQKSHAHFLAVNSLKQQKLNIASQLNKALQKNQSFARISLKYIITTLRYLCAQGQSIRGHDNVAGNFENLLILRSEDSPDLKNWLQNYKSFTSPAIQNEIIEIMANSVLREIRDDIFSVKNGIFAFIMDGTTDINTTDQQSCCIRFIDNDLIPREVFLGLYSAVETTGRALFKILEDVLLRFGLNMSCLRAQTYDGAANMSGAYSGCQALVKEKNPLALYVHCGAHCTNLVMESTANSHSILRDSIQWAHELGVLSKQNRKFKEILTQNTGDGMKSSIPLKPLCPTRWTVRGKNIRIILANYEKILEALEKFASLGSGETKTKANGLLERFTKGNTLLGLNIALKVLDLLENLNTSLQGRDQTASGMVAAVKVTKLALEKLRSDESFSNIFEDTLKNVEILELDPVNQPRNRKIPKRIDYGSPSSSKISNEDYFRRIYFQILDTSITNLQSRFSQASLETLITIEESLLEGKVSVCLSAYPELNVQKLSVQVPMFRDNYNYKSLKQAVEIFQDLPAEVKTLFSEIEKVLRLLLVVPSSSCEAERSFSALRRLKTYLRNSMLQKRLNNLLVCHVHKDKLNSLDVDMIINEFVKLNDIRKKTFGI